MLQPQRHTTGKQSTNNNEKKKIVTHKHLNADVYYARGRNIYKMSNRANILGLAVLGEKNLRGDYSSGSEKHRQSENPRKKYITNRIKYSRPHFDQSLRLGAYASVGSAPARKAKHRQPKEIFPVVCAQCLLVSLSRHTPLVVSVAALGNRNNRCPVIISQTMTTRSIIQRVRARLRRDSKDDFTD